MNNKLLIEYCASVIEEMRKSRRRAGGYAPVKSSQKKPLTMNQRSEQNNDKSLIEEHHQPIILSILNDVSDLDESAVSFPVSKEFIGFSKPSREGHSMQRVYVNERFLDKNDFSKLEIYNKSRGIENIDIGTKKESYIIPVTYVLLSDILEYYSNYKSRNKKINAPDLHKRSLDKRRYDVAGGSGLIRTSNEVKVQVLNALRHLGLVSLGSDILDLNKTDDIQQIFARQFSKLGWKDSVRKLGYSPGVSEEEASKIIKQNQGVRRDRDADSVSKTNDLLGVMASSNPESYYLGMNKQEFDDAVEALAVMISDENIIFTLGFAIKNWQTWANLSEDEMSNIISLSMTGEFDEAEVEIRKFMARGYQSFMDDKVQRDPELEKIRIKKEIEIDDKGYPTNLNDKELSDYYGVIYRDINFVEFVLPHIIAKSKKQKKSSYNPMSTPPVPEWALRGNTAFDRAFVKSWRQNYR